MHELLSALPTLEEIVRWGGYTGLFAIIFAETGLLLGAFLPGDSLLITTGVFARAGELNILVLMSLLSVAAILGDSVGYWFGAKTGRPLFDRPNSRFFKREHLLKTQEFYEKYGGFAIVLARFMPFARTFAPICAGIATMRYSQFLLYNVFGGLLWVCSMSLTGYYLAGLVPDIESKIHIVIGVVIFLSILPGIVHLLRARQKAPSNA